MSRLNEERAMAQLTVVTVTLEDRQDGGLRVYSENLPGLILSGSDQRSVVDCIIPAISLLFSERGRHAINVTAAQDIDECLAGASPRDIDLHVKHQQFVVEFAEAA